MTAAEIRDLRERVKAGTDHYTAGDVLAALDALEEATKRIADMRRETDENFERNKRDGITVREACRRRLALSGPDAQALEHALEMTEDERDKARRAMHEERILKHEAIARAERAEAALAKAEDDAERNRLLAARWRLAWVAIVNPGPSEMKYADENVAATAGDEQPDLVAVLDIREQRNKAHRELNNTRDDLARVRTELNKTREAGAAALAQVVLLSERLAKAEADRDEAMTMYCHVASKLTAIADEQGAEQPGLSSRGIADRTWPDAADRLFPKEGKR